MNEVATRPSGDIMERVLMAGDLARLQPADRVKYYNAVCESVGLNPLTRPFEYINLNGKLTLYARKDATEQLRKINGVSVEKLERETTEGIYVVTAYLKDKTGRMDSSIGAVPIENLKGEAKANAMMKAETKAKRRGTLSISGLGWLDETEVDSIPDAKRVDAATVESDPPKRGPGRPKNPVKLVDAEPAPATVVLAPAGMVQEIVVEPEPPDTGGQPEPPPNDAPFPEGANIVKEPGVSQAQPPPETQALPKEPKGTTPIQKPTMQAIYKAVGVLNKVRGQGVAQKVIFKLRPDSAPLQKWTEEEAQECLEAMETAGGLEGDQLTQYIESLGG